MREIKFRVWDFDLKKFHYYQGIFGHKRPFTESSTFVQYESCPKFHNVSEEEQFTGLKDKNGVDIYGGDILRKPAKNKWEEVNYTCYEVFFHDNDFAAHNIGYQLNRLHFQGAVCGDTLIFSMLPRHTSKLIVIGNIHKNPELLK